MDTGKMLYEKLRGFKKDISPQKSLLEYCVNELGGIESLHYDFKISAGFNGRKLEDDDQRNLAKAVSGFANSGGGVLIWGIEDETISAKPIKSIKKFTSMLLSLAPQTTDPPVPGIDGDWIPSDSEPTEGFALIYIPESLLPPHRVILKNKKREAQKNNNTKIQSVHNHYYFRSGEDFLVASHSQLEDMFGRRPRPILTLYTTILHDKQHVNDGSIKLRVIIGIENNGRGIAKYPFLNVRVNPPYILSQFGIDGNLNFGLKPLVRSMYSNDNERKFCSPDIVIYPDIKHDVAFIDGNVDQSTPDLVIDYTIAAEGVMPFEGQVLKTVQDLIGKI